MTIEPNELWAPITGFSGYSISTLGRVRSEARTVMKAGKPYWKRETILKASPHKGYPRVSLRAAGKTHYLFCHQIVMTTFVGRCPNGQETRHKDGNSLNPRLDNLEYGTRAQNIDDAKRHGTFPLHERRPGAKLTKAKVRKIASSRDTAGDLANSFGVTVGTIQQIRSAQTWADITEGARKSSYRPRGVAHPQAKLTEKDVRAIRKSGLSQRALARRYSVDRVTIRNVIQQKTWKHVQ